jgi:transcriptional regulator with XRE-family HTH domain
VTIKERISLALERSDKSQRDLAKFMGLAAPTINSMLSKDEIDSIKYLKAVEDLTGFRFEWLRTGKEPERVDQADKGEEPTFAGLNEALKTKNELIDELRARINDMKKYQELLEKQIKGKKG